jgi:hypothetical protein
MEAIVQTRLLIHIKRQKNVFNETTISVLMRTIAEQIGMRTIPDGNEIPNHMECIATMERSFS